MMSYVGVVRTAKGLRTALEALKVIGLECLGDTVLANMILTARLITAAALQRKESRGGHYRSDFPESDPALAHRTYITVADLERIDAPARKAPAGAVLTGCRT
jgi:L-aspartate oxidase